METAGETILPPEFTEFPKNTTGFLFSSPYNVRDVKWLGDCQSGITELATLLGWEKELESICKS